MLDIIVKLLERYGYMFIDGLKVTLVLSAIAVVLGLPIGACIAIMRMSKFKNKWLDKFNPLKFVASVYVEVLRGTPLLLQLYFFYFMLPNMIPFVDLSSFQSIAIALIVNSSAYVSEVIRSGIQAVDRGQTEAARTLGLNGFQTMLHIVLPQAVKNILPALCNEFVSIIKETSLASTFFIGDLMTQYNTIRGVTYRVIEPLIIVGCIYLVVTFTLSKLIAAYERRLKVGD
ncbi:MAG: amino acid ABC transporter permease [Clostridia bacterium]|nr:amino acid ABC transporter permease [Clostridia bacterium]